MPVLIEKTSAIKLLENRRDHLLKWLKEGDTEIAAAEQLILNRKQVAIEIANEIIEIEAALNHLIAAQQSEQKESDNG